MSSEKIVLCSDHGGWEIKEYFKQRLTKDQIEFIDFGVLDKSSVDYPDIIAKGAQAIARGEYQKGIFFCGSGVGASIVANRYHNVRAALAYNKAVAQYSRLHNNANVIVFGGRFIGFSKAYKLFKLWYNTPFEDEERHSRRVKKMDSCGPQ